MTRLSLILKQRGYVVEADAVYHDLTCTQVCLARGMHDAGMEDDLDGVSVEPLGHVALWGKKVYLHPTSPIFPAMCKGYQEMIIDLNDSVREQCLQTHMRN